MKSALSGRAAARRAPSRRSAFAGVLAQVLLQASRPAWGIVALQRHRDDDGLAVAPQVSGNRVPLHRERRRREACAAATFATSASGARPLDGRRWRALADARRGCPAPARPSLAGPALAVVSGSRCRAAGGWRRPAAPRGRPARRGRRAPRRTTASDHAVQGALLSRRRRRRRSSRGPTSEDGRPEGHHDKVATADQHAAVTHPAQEGQGQPRTAAPRPTATVVPPKPSARPGDPYKGARPPRRLRGRGSRSSRQRTTISSA